MLKDLTGQRFGFLTVISRNERKSDVTYWNCVCDCGKETVVSRPSLIQGRTRSCGCYHNKMCAERIAKIRTTHGMTNTRLYTVWVSMKARCLNTKNKRYEQYGGRGIKICEDWKSFEPFRDWALENGYNDNLSIERIDVDGNYDPQNCKWIPMSDQAKNTRSNRRVTINGETRILSEWSRISGIKAHTIRHRIIKGYPESEWLKPPRECLTQLKAERQDEGDILRALEDIKEGNRAAYKNDNRS